MLKFQYKIKLGRKLNLDNPMRYSEKLQWYKINYRNPLLTTCADKLKVRDFINSKGLGDILTKLYAVYEINADFDINQLPEKFVIKTTNGSGTNIICKNKNEIDIDNVKKDLKKWMKRDNFAVGREWSYKYITPKVIFEEYLEDLENKYSGINDYKFICFKGKVHYIVFDVDRFVEHKRNIYDVNWNLIDVKTDCGNIEGGIDKPTGLQEMIDIASALSKDFPSVRVDLYWVNGKVYFGEMTFYPWTGYVNFSPDEFDFTLGANFPLIRY